jgi:hypothetical protein
VGKAESGAVLGLALALLAGGPALAAPEEIEVYRDELQAPGAWSLETNQSYVVSGPREDEPGELPSVGRYRLTPEIAYGLAPHWDAGVLAMATVRGGALDAHGIKSRIRYIAPHAEGRPYWGGNLEVGWTDHHLEAKPWSAELRGIWGYEGKLWILALNPTLEMSAGRGPAEPLALEIQAKVGRRLGDSLILGLESYNDFGPVQRFSAFGQESQMVYATADIALKHGDLNLGLGHGLNGVSDGWAVKAVWGLPLGRARR